MSNTPTPHNEAKLGDIDTVGSIESTFVMSEVKQNYGINL